MYRFEAEFMAVGKGQHGRREETKRLNILSESWGDAMARLLKRIGAETEVREGWGSDTELISGFFTDLLYVRRNEKIDVVE